MLKKCVSVLLAVLMTVSLFTIIPLTANAEEILESGDYSYVLVEKGEATVAEITAYSGAQSALSIPGAIDGYSVNAIRREAFRSKDFLTSVVIPDTVTFIADFAFSNCTNLENVTLSSKLDDLARASFYNCTSLTEITLPASLTKCYSNSGTWMTFRGPFNGCSNLSTINFASGFSKIPDYLFEGCTGITSINIPDTVTSIEERAFYNCTNLTEVTIPDSVKSIGTAAFSDCTALEKIICSSDDIETIGQYAVNNSPDVVFYGKHSASNLKAYAKDTLGRPFYGIDHHSNTEWSWSDDLSTASVKIYCNECDEGDATVEATVTSEITKPKTCTEDGERYREVQGQLQRL